MQPGLSPTRHCRSTLVGHQRTVICGLCACGWAPVEVDEGACRRPRRPIHRGSASSAGKRAMRALAPLGAWRALLGAYKCPVAPAQRVAATGRLAVGAVLRSPGQCAEAEPHVRSYVRPLPSPALRIVGAWATSPLTRSLFHRCGCARSAKIQPAGPHQRPHRCRAWPGSQPLPSRRCYFGHAAHHAPNPV